MSAWCPEQVPPGSVLTVSLSACSFWNLRSQFVEIKATTTTLPIRIQLHDIGPSAVIVSPFLG